MKTGIKRLIKDKGIKQLDIAKEMAVSESHVSLMLRGKRRINMEQAHQMASMLDISMDELFVKLND